jgi:lysophospholipase L1-like esterase
MPDSPKGPPVFSVRRSLVYSTVLIVSFFALLEGGLRLVGIAPPVRSRVLLRLMDVDITFPFMRADKTVFWSPEPGYSGEFMGQRVSINALGLRGTDVTLPRPAGQRYLLVFGDSITFGYGVSDSDTYPAQLDALLRGRGVRVLNAGVTGFSSHQVRNYLPSVAQAAQADLAAFCIGWNDVSQRAISDREYERGLRRVMTFEGVADHVYTYRLFQSLFSRGLRARMKADTKGPRVSEAEYADNLRALASYCRAGRIRPVFVMPPSRKQATGEARRFPYRATLVAVASAEDVPLVEVPSLGPDSESQDTSAFFLDSLHLTPAGHARFAAELARLLAERQVL